MIFPDAFNNILKFFNFHPNLETVKYLVERNLIIQ